MTSLRAGKTLAVLALLALWLATDADGYLAVLDDANMAFHQAGHAIFGLLGPAARLYGGPAMQLFFPVMVLLSFWARRHSSGFVLGWAWLCENVLNLAREMADARARVLPHLGSHGQDWTALLERWGLLESDERLAGLVRAGAHFGLVLAALWTLWRWQADSAARRSSALRGPWAE
jgi:hypothetical protein